MKHRKLGTFGLIITAMLLLLAASSACGGDSDSGQQTYLNNCAACHGQLGEGNPDWRVLGDDGRYPPPPHDSTGHTWHHADGLLFRIVKLGGASLNIPNFKSGMPAFQDTLDDGEIREVLLYIKTLWGEEEREFQAANSIGDPFP